MAAEFARFPNYTKEISRKSWRWMAMRIFWKDSGGGKASFTDCYRRWELSSLRTRCPGFLHCATWPGDSTTQLDALLKRSGFVGIAHLQKRIGARMLKV